MKRSRVLLVVAIVVVAAVLIAVAVQVVKGQQASSSCSISDTTPVTIFGEISLPTGSLGSNFSLTVINTTCQPIVGIEVTSVNPPIPGVANAAFVAYDGTLVSRASVLPAREIGTGSVQVSGIVSGQEYTLVIVVTFASGAPTQTHTVGIYPESP